MSEPISVISQAFHQIPESQKIQQGNEGKRSFESVLQQPVSQDGEQQSPVNQPTGVSGSKLEQMQRELMDRVDKLGPGKPKITALMPEIIDLRTRSNMVREAFRTMGSNTQLDPNLRGRLGQVENEWYQLESIMRSDRDLSTGELLGLQARLYQVSQHVEVLSKVVDQVTGGIKTILNTNV